MEHGMLLIVVTDLDIRTELETAGRRRFLFVQDFQERRFTGTVRTDDGDMFATLDFEGNVREQCLLAEGLTELLHGQHIVSGLKMRGQC